MKSIELKWPEFNLDMNAVEAWLRANAGPEYIGNTAHAVLHLWFHEEPSGDIQQLIAQYWEELSEESEESLSYKSRAEREEAAIAKKASAKAKLLALGLTQEEVDALAGSI